MDYSATYNAIVREVGGIDDTVDQLLSRYADFVRGTTSHRRYASDSAARAAVLRIMLGKFSQISQTEDVDAIAKRAHGFTPADLQSLCLRVFMEYKGDATADNVLAMVETVKPSNLSSFQSKIPRVAFADIFGLDQTIARRTVRIAI
ncbi:hypothetical protein GGI14_001155 [Coemansia sp. S680]|nr:hypothetical protein GGI14_001155 [Coemansia sp. S680]